MDNSEVDKAMMDFYSCRRVTRSQFEEFLRNPHDTRPFCHLLRENIPEHQREALFNAGDSVCRIDIDGHPEGTGFHLGGGWVMTNQHVICDGNEERSNVSKASFIFPTRTIEPAPRNVIFSYFQDPVGTKAVNDSRKDLALIEVEEILNFDTSRLNYGLGNIAQKPAEEGARVFLIHYGDGVEDRRNPPQQFSVSDNEMCFSVENRHGNRFSVHTAHSRPGSSGAPLLVFDEKLQKFLVAAVHYAGPESAKMIDSPGFALWYAGKEWLQKTVVAHSIRAISLQSDPKLWTISDPIQKRTFHDMYVQRCEKLDEYLKQHSLRLTVTTKLPEGVAVSCSSITFAQ